MNMCLCYFWSPFPNQLHSLYWVWIYKLYLLISLFFSICRIQHRQQRAAQFNQNYQPGSISTNINNPIGYGGFGDIGYGGGAFLGQQNYNYGSFANNFAGGFGRRKRSAQFNQNYQPVSISTNINNAQHVPEALRGQQNFNAGSIGNNLAGPGRRAFHGQQNYNAGSVGNNFAGGYGGSFNGQQNYNYGNVGNNYAAGFGKKK